MLINNLYHNKFYLLRYFVIVVSILQLQLSNTTSSQDGSMFKKRLFYPAILLSAATLLFVPLSCNIQEAIREAAEDIVAALAKIEVSNASTLYIAEEGTGSDTENVLYKQTETGDIEPVKFYDQENNVISLDVEPDVIYDVDTNYVIIGFGYSSGYLVRKTDNAVFSLDKVGLPYGSTYMSGDVINTDSDGNIYYVSRSTSELIKLDVQDPENIVKEVYSATGDSVSRFTLDSSGNVAYFGSDSGGESIQRMRRAVGPIFFANMPGATNMSHRVTWLGFDDKIYYYNSDVSEVAQIFTSINPLTNNDYGTLGLWASCGFEDFFYIKNKNSIVSPGGCSSIFELYNIEGNPRKFDYTDLGLNTVKIGSSSDNFYYLTGQNTTNVTVLIRIDPDDDNTTQLLPTTADPLIEYDIYKISSTPDDVITFNALRMSDGKIVLGTISVAGTLTILKEDLQNQVVVLERIQ